MREEREMREGRGIEGGERDEERDGRKEGRGMEARRKKRRMEGERDGGKREG